MRTALIFAAAVTLATATSAAHAVTIPGGGGIKCVIEETSPIEQAQVFVYRGRSYCFYLDGWNGPGWYRCGYAWRRGLGFGGAYGWNRWYLPRYHTRYYHGRGWDRRREIRRDHRQNRRGVRQERRQQQQGVRQERRIQQQGVRQERREMRRDFRQDQRGMRQQSRGDRQQFRQERRQQMQGQRGGGEQRGMRGGGQQRGGMERGSVNRGGYRGRGNR